jgi:hypothetical protein
MVSDKILGDEGKIQKKEDQMDGFLRQQRINTIRNSFVREIRRTSTFYFVKAKREGRGNQGTCQCITKRTQMATFG